jgi:alpha-beta hydrolase superfamily lysophospholipase
VQKDHAEDPFDAFTHPTHNISLRDFIDMMLCIEGTEWAEKVPTDLPILLIAGDQDPVGNFGEGVYACANWLTDTGHDVTTKLYTGYRHEIHNYDELKFEVESDIIDWLRGPWPYFE